MVSFSLRQPIFLPPPTGPSPVSFHLSQFALSTGKKKGSQFLGFSDSDLR